MTPETISATPGLAASTGPRVLAFDVGGTWVKYGIVDARGRLLFSDQLATQGEPDGKALLARLLAVAGPLVARHAPAGIAFSTLGIIDAAEGRLVGAVEAISGYFGQSPKESFERAFGIPVVVENDGNCVALAEGWTGAAAGVHHYLALTLGTGIGGGIVIDGKLYRGAHGAAGEWGYMLVDGKVWEDHASPRGLAAAAEVMRPGCGFDAEAVFAARDRGDAEMAALVARWFALLATGLANLLFAFNPSRVVIGGGITARGPAFLQELQAEMRKRLRPEFHRMCEIALASAGNQAGLLGAARLWLAQHAPDTKD
ncbi:ROK family protein [Scleromatobacter humisilvae]|uniref:ROK family protein n=1 Tax=Scleromatobacter humisilvae TaxID=2897159 RepID=A0A9X1YRR4_9BURK|nr:ROK family protein [Scleromatobacter humisilvae]MCK9687546.1 ROK family protein [Scleromatobacter humisilvae]